ncbi:MAG: hypothetical protein EXS17_06545 [Phycisphaerales bacterium]|nr:hypothetical protein [Phycisphaerales bacterium]
MGVKYRFKSGDFISGWILADGLRDAVEKRQLTADSTVQQAGRDDWIAATLIPGLITVAAIGAAVEPSVKESEPARVDPRHGTRPGESIHHLLYRVLHMTIHVVAHNDEHDGEPAIAGMLIGVTAEGIMVEFTQFGAIVYIPLTRIRCACIMSKFPTLGPPRRGEIVQIEVDALPDLHNWSSRTTPEVARTDS